MANSLVTNDALKMAQYALDGLSMRQQQIGHNLANVDTPGYRAKNVEFESVLKQAISSPQVMPMKLTNTAHLGTNGSMSAEIKVGQRTGGALRADENSVDIDVELSQMAETGIKYQAISTSVSKRLLLLKAIASGR